MSIGEEILRERSTESLRASLKQLQELRREKVERGEGTVRVDRAISRRKAELASRETK